MSPFIQHFHAYGGDERDRTDDPLLAKQVLSQLSYTPINGFKALWRSFSRLEPQKLNNDYSFDPRLHTFQYADLEVSVLFHTACSIERR